MKLNTQTVLHTGLATCMAGPLLGVSLLMPADAAAQKFRHVASPAQQMQQTQQHDMQPTTETIESDTVPVPSVEELLEKAVLPARPYTAVNKALGPRVFSGYRKLTEKRFSGISLSPDFSLIHKYYFTEVPDSLVIDVALGKISRDEALRLPDEEEEADIEELPEIMTDIHTALNDSTSGLPEILISGPVTATPDPEYAIDITSADVTPGWLREALTANRLQEDLLYSRMIEHPDWIQYSDWTLPKPPRLPEDDINFASYIRKLDLPEVDLAKAYLPKEEIDKRHWLHIFQGSVQFSQAYVSSTWYQGGNNHLSLLFNLLWDVSLNRVWHPNLMFQSVASYKLGLNSTPSGSYHRYSISEDIFQWNMQAGFKAFTNWFYSLTTQFKTQLLCNYEEKGPTRTASFLSPATFNVGLGMTYNKENAKKTFKISASISPISYNLATVIDPKVDPTPYKVTPPHKTNSEIGSNAEVNVNWKLHQNITYRGRLFLFSDYKSFLGDWENTFDFAITKFLSTQIYVHMRYDTQSALIEGSKWGHWQLKEILSFGLSYRFSTK